jgi:hypothetical protein
MYPIEYTWIRKPTPVIIRSMSDERGSMRKAMSEVKPAVEIQVISVTVTARWSWGKLKRCKNATIEKINERKTVPHAR